MIKVSKTKASDYCSTANTDSKNAEYQQITPELYISISGFKDMEEQRIIFEKTELMIKEWQSKRTVFG